MFKKVSALNELFGNPKGNPTNPNWDRLKSQAANIEDEYNELIDDGLVPKNMTEVRDAICDILVFTLGLAHMAGINVEEDMDAVNKSNLSKFCRDQAEVDRTQLKYSTIGIETYVEGEFPLKRVKTTKYQLDINNKVYQAHKMLKSTKFKEPVFKAI